MMNMKFLDIYKKLNEYDDDGIEYTDHMFEIFSYTFSHTH